jgi:hypothetical protein
MEPFQPSAPGTETTTTWRWGDARCLGAPLTATEVDPGCAVNVLWG